jgi:hypothetical protein
VELPEPPPRVTQEPGVHACHGSCASAGHLIRVLCALIPCVGVTAGFNTRGDPSAGLPWFSRVCVRLSTLPAVAVRSTPPHL